jgi:exonuclease III
MTFLPSHIVREIESNFTVHWRDSPEYLSKIIKDYQLNPEKKAVIEHLYSQYCPSLKYEFNYEPFVELRSKVATLDCLKPDDENTHLIRIEPQCKKVNIAGFTCYQIPAGVSVYKGFRTFVTDEEEHQYVKTTHEKCMPIWFGNLLIAYEYAQMYCGGLNAYKTSRPVNMLVFTNYENIMKILDELQALVNKGVKKLKLGNEEYNLFYIMKNIRIKTGAGIRITKLMEEYLSYNKKTELLLSKTANLNYYKNMINNELIKNNTCYMPKDDKTSCSIRIIPKIFYWGRGKIDRIVYKFVNAYINEKYKDIDGCMSVEHYSPFSSNGIVGEEFVFSESYVNFLKRDVSDKYDWTNWINKLPFKFPLGFKMRTTFDAKNIDFRAIRFVVDHDVKTKHNLELINEVNRLRKNKTVVLLSFNVHFFESIDATINNIDAYAKFIELIQKYSPDLVCIQGDMAGAWMTIDERTKAAQALNYFYSGHLKSGLFIMSKKETKIDVLQLPNKLSNDIERRALMFTYEGMKFINTTLEVGNRYTNRNGSLQTPVELYDNLMINSQNRLTQLEFIEEHKPDFVTGTLYVDLKDPEIDFIMKHYKMNNEKYSVTSVYNNHIDYILSRSHNVLLQDIIDYPFSDHLPIISVIQC